MTQATILHEPEVELWEAVAYYEDKAAGLGLELKPKLNARFKPYVKLPGVGRFVKMVRGDISPGDFPSS